MIDPQSSDWSDLDLLTVGEARERLAHEITVVEGEIAATEQAGGTDQLDSLRRRLALLQARLQL